MSFFALCSSLYFRLAYLPKPCSSSLGRHLASLLAHSLALCAEPKSVELGQTQEGEGGGCSSLAGVPLDAIPASPTISPSPTQTASTSFFADSTAPSSATSPVSPFICEEPPSATSDALPTLPAHPTQPAFPVLSQDDRFRLISGLQSWSFNAMSYSSDELLACAGLIFEGVRSMEGVEFDHSELSSSGLTCGDFRLGSKLTDHFRYSSHEIPSPVPSISLPLSKWLSQLLSRYRCHSSVLYFPRSNGTRSSTLPFMRRRLRSEYGRGEEEVEKEQSG